MGRMGTAFLLLKYVDNTLEWCCNYSPEGPKAGVWFMAQRAKSGSMVYGPKGQKRGCGFYGGGSQPPFRQLGDLGERCKLPSAAQSRAPLAKRFAYI